MGSRDPVVVVGAGLAGLCCARGLHRAGVPVAVIEAQDAVGGRVRTDLREGFRLDRGFQVLLTAYPEALAVLDYAALDLRPFLPGALVRRGSRFHRVSDPWRRPQDALTTLRAGVGTLGDKLRLARLRGNVRRGTLAELMARPQSSTLERLRRAGFSEAMIDGFFRPFFGGILLDRSLAASSRMFDFVFRMMASGGVALPARGMGAIPEQLAGPLPHGSLRLGTAVDGVTPGGVRLVTGETLAARAVVLAVEGPEAARLLGRPAPPPPRSVVCVYFDAPEPPVGEPVLVLDGDGRGPVNNLCCPSLVAPDYAPAGHALVSATVLDGQALDDPTLEAAIREQLGDWFGAGVAGWRRLAVQRIPHAQPRQEPADLEPAERPVRVERGLYVCGDHRETASIQGAMASGRRAAEALIADLGRR